MAAVTFTGQYVSLGNVMAAVGKITLTDQSSGAVQIPGIGKILDGGALLTPQTSAGPNPGSYSVNVNAASGGTASNGYVRIKSAISGYVFNAMIVGTS